MIPTDITKIDSLLLANGFIQEEKRGYWKKYHFLQGIINYHNIAQKSNNSIRPESPIDCPPCT
jgi:hypothetical protein